jgi:hypothetical protein
MRWLRIFARRPAAQQRRVDYAAQIEAGLEMRRADRARLRARSLKGARTKRRNAINNDPIVREFAGQMDAGIPTG